MKKYQWWVLMMASAVVIVAGMGSDADGGIFRRGRLFGRGGWGSCGPGGCSPANGFQYRPAAPLAPAPVVPKPAPAVNPDSQPVSPST